MELSSSVGVIGVHAFRTSLLQGEVYRDFYELVQSWLQSHGAQPTFVAAEGAGHSGKFTRVGGRTQKRLVETGFKGVSVLSLVSNPAGSDEPSYDSFVSASLLHLPATNEVMLCCALNGAIVPFGEPTFLAWLRDLTGLHRWDHGYAFADKAKRQPELFVLGLDSGQLSADERKALTAWYTAPEARMDRLRGVFPLMLVNERHLASGVGDDTTLRDFISAQKGSSLSQLADNGLHLWTVPTDALNTVRLG